MHALRSFYQKIINFGDSFQSILLLIIRLYWGYNFFQAGLGKLNDVAGVTPFFRELGFPLPELVVYLVGGVELVGGLMLLIGFGTRLAAIPLIITMIVAYLVADFEAVKTLFSKPENFIKSSPFNYLLASLILLAFGAGKISLDYLLERFVIKRKN